MYNINTLLGMWICIVSFELLYLRELNFSLVISDVNVNKDIPIVKDRKVFRWNEFKSHSSEKLEAPKKHRRNPKLNNTGGATIVLKALTAIIMFITVTIISAYII